MGIFNTAEKATDAKRALVSGLLLGLPLLASASIDLLHKSPSLQAAFDSAITQPAFRTKTAIEQLLAGHVPDARPHLFSQASAPEGDSFVPAVDSPLGARRLAQASDADYSTVEAKSLQDICPDVDLTAQNFTCITTGVVESGNLWMIDVNVPKLPHLDIEVTPVMGDVDAYVLKRADDTFEASYMLRSEKAVGVERLFVSKWAFKQKERPTLVLRSFTHDAAFRLRVQAVENAPKITQHDLGMLEHVHSACCAKGWCAPAFEELMKNIDVDHCHADGWHCNEFGQVTHIRLTAIGMNCDVESLYALHRLPALEYLDLSGNAIYGDLNKLLGYFVLPNFDAPLTDLGLAHSAVSGELPATCSETSILRNLKALRIHRTPVTGSIPECLVSNAQQLNIENTYIGGLLPPIPEGSELEYFMAGNTMPGAGNAEWLLKGRNLDFRAATRLHTLTINYQEFKGTVYLGPNTEVLDVSGNTLDGIEIGGVDRLSMVSVQDSGLTRIPDAFAQAPHLLQLYAARNNLAAIPVSWQTPKLRILDLSWNELTGPFPNQLAFLPALSVLHISHNHLDDTLDSLTSLLTTSRSRIIDFQMRNNSLSGSLTGLEKLGVFDVANSLIVGANNQKAAHRLDVSDNAFSGEVPLDAFEAAVVASQGDKTGSDNASISVYVYVENTDVSCSDLETAHVLLRGCPEEKSKSDVSTGAAVGIAIACVLAVAAVVGGLFAVRRAQRARAMQAASGSGTVTDEDTYGLPGPTDGFHLNEQNRFDVNVAEQ